MIVPEDVAANLISEGTSYEGMPEPWVFDGTRRMYDKGLPLQLWQARAVDSSEPHGSDRKLVFTVGDTPMNATIALVEKLQEGTR